MSFDSKNKTFFIVESPNKIKKIRSILYELNYSHFEIFATMGHFRDLTVDPKFPLGIDIDVDKNTIKGIFSLNKKNFFVTKLNNIKKIYQNKNNYNCTFYLASDPDREGEAIAWHIYECLKSNNQKFNNFTFYRVKYQSITKEEIKSSIENASNINMNLVHAQLTRRYIDRIVGWLVSPLVQKNCNVMSAGRVQSIVVKLIVERNIDIEYFNPEYYYHIYGNFKHISNYNYEYIDQKYQLIHPDTNLFKFSLEEYKEYNIYFNNLNEFVNKYNYEVVEEKIYPNKPFITSTIQKECSKKFKWNVKKTMNVLQNLFENGYITYHRTDSYYIHEKELNTISNYIIKKYGREYSFKNKNNININNSQEAHECIRPTNIYLESLGLNSNNNIDHIDDNLLYELIFKRTLMSQMVNGIDEIKNEYIISNNNVINKVFKFVNTTRNIKSLGFRILIQNDIAIPNSNKNLNNLDHMDNIILINMDYPYHHTTPPSKYNQASLITKMEEELIGRPSTYAYILDKIINMNCGIYFNNYYDINEIEKCENYIQFLNDKFDKLFMNIEYTRNMEKDLDSIANGELLNWENYVIHFYKNIKYIL